MPRIIVDIQAAESGGCCLEFIPPLTRRQRLETSLNFYPIHCTLWTKSEGLAYRQIPGVTIRRTAVVEPHHDALLLLNRELQPGAGLHMTDVKLALEAETTASDLRTSTGRTSVPLPVVSFALGYAVTPRFDWYLKAEVFALSFDDWSGSYNDALLGVEYRLLENLGVGAALSSNSLRVLEEKAETRFEFTNRISGIMFFLRGHF